MRKDLADLAAALGLPVNLVHRWGPELAKIDPAAIDAAGSSQRGRLILVSAITPTPAGEGKTTTSIGLGDGLSRLGQSVCLALREPSLGPCMGIKGGGAGGGLAQLHPARRINLHFTGDFHALTSAHNLLAAAIDNHLHFHGDAQLDARRVVWPRVIDMNDRALRHVVIGLGGQAHGDPRETSFDITAASELMAMLCLTDGAEDLRARIERTLIGFGRAGEPITAGEFKVTGAMLALLRDALMPNLVQTLEGTPALVHGGPFANIAHGCNSVIATRTALQRADWVVTEAGFGFDLGAEKFFDIKCRSSGLDAHLVVLVASVRALRMHGGVPIANLGVANAPAVERGLANLDKHIDSIRRFGKTPVIALNRFEGDHDEEIAIVRDHCEQNKKLAFAVTEQYTRGGEGALELARAVIETANAIEPTAFVPLYQLDDDIPSKICAVAKAIYGADDVAFTKAAERDLRQVVELGYHRLPVCIAKTQSSLSDDPKLLGRPRDFQITVRELRINSGAGFIVVLTGDILRMPGLPRAPQAERIDLVDGEIAGLS